MNRETIIISLGGSLVAPGEIDLEFLKSFKNVLCKYLKQKQFFVFVGGGKICRVYQKALLEFGAKENQRDLIGIDISRLNAAIIKQMFGSNAYPKIITDPNKKVSTSKAVVVGAGWKPGRSTDYVSAVCAKTNNIKTIINLTNIDYVYDKNPKEFADAKPLENISWQDFQKIVGSKWTPGLSKPFDPIASALAQKQRMKVVIINGNKLQELENFLNNKPFLGTTIQ